MLLHEDADMRVSARAYRGGEAHPPHHDRCARVSFVVRGAVAETTARASVVAAAGDVLLKSNTVAHEDRFAPSGAVIASAEFAADGALALDNGFDWACVRDASALRAGVSLLDAASANEAHAVRAAAVDLVAAAGEAAETNSAGAPPRWLLQLRDALEAWGLAQVDVAAHAIAAGVHPVHGSRLFRRHFGRSATDFAQAHAVRRAFALMAEPAARLSDAAVAAGFYDQSHMNRCFQRTLGVTPGRARRLALGVAGGG